MKQKNNEIGTKIWNIIENIMDYILRKIFRLKISDKQWNTLTQFVKFGIVGLSNTAISYLIYVITLLIFQKNVWIPSWDYLVAQIIAFVLSVLWSFYWNNKYVFKKGQNAQRSLVKTLLKTYMSYAFTGLFLNSILSFLWVEVLYISKLVAPIINLLISVPLNFVMNKFWAFRDKR